MKIENVTLYEMLNAREKRYEKQKHLLHIYPGTLVCFMLNIPGPVKVFEGLDVIFEEGVQKIRNVLQKEEIRIFTEEAVYEKTGYEYYFMVGAPALKVKGKLIILEEESKIGRLYDIDVFSRSHTKINRSELGRTKRKCIVCDGEAYACGRNRNHSIAEMMEAIRKVITED